MHEKLSEAVKLYDRLLTEQVSHPPWRATASARPANATYQQPPSSYGQWSIPQQSTPVQGPPSYYPSQATAYDRQVPIATTSSVAAPPAESYPQVASTSSSRAEYPQSPQQESYSAASPPPAAISQYPQQTISTNIPNPSSSHQYQPTYVPSAVHSPPPLSRQNTLTSYGQAPPSITAQSKPVVRSNTISQSHAPQQLQQLQHTSVPPQLPNFPVVPTASPQSYSSPQPEPQRDALLIDL
jgi:hepatocyte growth factor-regulated tyrosine kinase substrate